MSHCLGRFCFDGDEKAGSEAYDQDRGYASAHGDEATLGESNRNAILLAASQLSSSTKYNYQLVFEDDQFNPALGATAVNKLISVDGVSALISFGSPVGNAVSPIAEADHVTHINDFASDPHVASGTYNFVDYTPAYKDSSLFIAELKKRNIHNLVFFGQQDNPGVTAIIADFLRDASSTPGIKIFLHAAVQYRHEGFQDADHRSKTIQSRHLCS